MARKAATHQSQETNTQTHQYLNPAWLGNLGGLDRYRSHKRISRRKAVEDLAKIDAYTVHKERRRKFQRNPVIALERRHQFQADLLDVQKISKQNKHKKFLLVTIDAFSKRASCIPIHKKTGAEVCKGFDTAFRDLGEPEKLQVDEGEPV